jgi:hypothetical protein
MTRIIPIPAGGSAGFTDATSKVGDSAAACPKAAQEVKMIRQTPKVALRMLNNPLLFKYTLLIRQTVSICDGFQAGTLG